jgi:hypothetical protein
LEAERRLLDLNDELSLPDEKSCKRLSDQLRKGTLNPATKFVFAIVLSKFHSPGRKMLESDLQRIMNEVGGFQNLSDAHLKRFADQINNVEASLNAFYIAMGNEDVLFNGLMNGANKTAINTRRQTIFNEVVLG